MSPWYLGSSDHLFFDVIYQEQSTLHRFQILLTPDLSSATLQLLNTLKIKHSSTAAPVGYQVCEDMIFSCGVYDSKSLWWTQDYAPLFFAVSPGGPAAKVIYPDLGRTYLDHSFLSCPASGTFLLRILDLDGSYSLVTLDFLDTPLAGDSM